LRAGARDSSPPSRISARRSSLPAPFAGARRSSVSEQLAASDGHRVTSENDPPVADPDRDRSSSRRGLVTEEILLPEPFGPVRPETAVRGARDGVLVDPRGGREVARDEIMSRRLLAAVTITLRSLPEAAASSRKSGARPWRTVTSSTSTSESSRFRPVKRGPLMPRAASRSGGG